MNNEFLPGFPPAIGYVGRTHSPDCVSSHPLVGQIGLQHSPDCVSNHPIIEKIADDEVGEDVEEDQI